MHVMYRRKHEYALIYTLRDSHGDSLEPTAALDVVMVTGKARSHDTVITTAQPSADTEMTSRGSYIEYIITTLRVDVYPLILSATNPITWRVMASGMAAPNNVR